MATPRAPEPAPAPDIHTADSGAADGRGADGRAADGRGADACGASSSPPRLRSAFGVLAELRERQRQQEGAGLAADAPQPNGAQAADQQHGSVQAGSTDTGGQQPPGFIGPAPPPPPGDPPASEGATHDSTCCCCLQNAVHAQDA